MRYYPPDFHRTDFHCPHCKVFAAQSWISVHYNFEGHYQRVDAFYLSECYHCKKTCYWFKKRLIEPSDAPVSPAHEDLPENCQQDYEEARNIFSQSPRSAAALLRLCVQKLLPHLGGKGKNINDDIKDLVQKGLPVLVQQSLDYCRVVGNNAVHPGEINLNDSPDVAVSLFELINFIVEDRITRPKQIDTLFNSLPDGAKEAIRKRDSKNSAP